MIIDDYDTWLTRGLHGCVNLLKERAASQKFMHRDSIDRFNSALEKLKDLRFCPKRAEKGDSIECRFRRVEEWIINGYIGLNQMLQERLNEAESLDNDLIELLKARLETLKILVERLICRKNS